MRERQYPTRDNILQKNMPNSLDAQPSQQVAELLLLCCMWPQATDERQVYSLRTLNTLTGDE